MALVVQALADYREDAITIFREETDQPQDIAEDVTREAIESMGVSGIHDRLYGKVDVKKTIYVFLPEPVQVALMLDAKAEKKNGDKTAMIQMSQISMSVKMMRAGEVVDEKGKLEKIIQRDDRSYQVVTVIAKYVYEEVGEGNASAVLLLRAFQMVVCRINTTRIQTTPYGLLEEMPQHLERILGFG